MAEKKAREKLPGIVKIALVASVVMLGLTPLANAAIDITITPNVCHSCMVTTYKVEITSDTPWTWQNTTIPKGFYVAPLSGSEIVRTDFSGNGHVGFVIITVNASDPSGNTVDVFAQVDGDSASTTQTISFAPGATFTITSPFGGASMMEVRWPTETEEGYAYLSVPFQLLNITDQYTLGLCCPEPGEESWFTATSEGNLEGDSASVICSLRAVPVYNAFGLAALVGIMSVVLGFATLRRRR